MHDATRYVLEHAEELRAEVSASDELGRLTDRTVELLRASGGMKLLQAQDCGGLQAHPVDFLDWVMAVGENHPSAGWVAGVVGIHPWEIAIADPRLQKEVYGADPETWVASPYAPIGRALPVQGGFRLTGRWPYSTGTDHAEWVVLGGMVADDQGRPVSPPDVRHFVLPRPDYEVLEGTWNVMGLAGTGSKDVEARDAFVPDYRVLDGAKVRDNSYSNATRPGSALYAMRFGLMFPFAIAAGTFGIARGAVNAAYAHIEKRVSTQGSVSKTDPFVLAALARAESDVEASISHVRTIVSAHFDTVAAGGDITVKDRLRFRRDQVRATDRAMEAVNDLYRLMGSSAIQKSSELERYWRDLQVASTHVCNAREACYLAWGLDVFGGEIPPTAQY
ncbi:acyl-CoA dehydrogenase family protein [Pedococcus sp. 5OH_020]|uniref:acyl-CoA dehydrogenase family protein n=1 Tax=Pedococcus sp. 5OH_020 TaxID=2989814 RepID=UPI0022E9DD41|nr:acyl-CoA dehydrogenase family protein [Pedococcus sp. 5OH_020]